VFHSFFGDNNVENKLNNALTSQANPAIPGLVEGENLVKFLRSCPKLNQVVGLEDEKKEINRILSRSVADVEEANNFILLAGVSGTGKLSSHL